MPHRKIIKLSIFNSIIRMLHIGIAFFFGIYFNSIGLGGAEIGLIFSIFTIASIITILPSGLSNDVFKSKHLITFSLVLSSVHFLGLAYTHSFPMIAVLFLIGGLGKAIYLPSAESLFYRASKKEHIPKRIAIFQGLQHFAIALGMVCAGYLLHIDVSFEKLFLIIGIIHIILTIVSHFILPDSKTTEFKIVGYKTDIFRKEVIFFLIIVALFSIHLGAEQTSYGLFLKQNLKLNNLELGLYTGIAVAFMSIAAAIISKKFKKWDASSILIFGLFLSGIFHILMIIDNIKISLIFRIFHEIGDAAIMFFLYYGVTQLFDLKRIGGNTGIVQLSCKIATAIGALIFGPIGYIYGYHIPLIIGGITTLIAGGLAIQFKHLVEHK